MRGHKFVCLVEANYFHEDEFTADINKQVVWGDDARLRVLTFPHENFADNLVELRSANSSDPDDVFEYARDIDGRLWYVDSWLSKLDIIKAFEQTDVY